MDGLKSLLAGIADEVRPYDILDRTAAAVRRRRRRNRMAPVVAGAVVAAAASTVLVVGLGRIGQSVPGDRSTWQERAEAIEGIVNYHNLRPGMVDRQDHRNGTISYPVLPPAGGPHNPRWQNCDGDVYPAPIANEHAVHSLEHGAVWITYRPNLPQDQIDLLAAKVEHRAYLFMSPYPGQDRPISLQAWGYQLKVNRADDPRIDEFISALRVNAALEPNANCADGITATGDKPSFTG